MGTIQQTKEMRTSRVTGGDAFSCHHTITPVDAQRLPVLSNFGEGLRLCTCADGAVHNTMWPRKGAARNAPMGSKPLGVNRGIKASSSRTGGNNLSKHNVVCGVWIVSLSHCNADSAVFIMMWWLSQWGNTDMHYIRTGASQIVLFAG